MRRCAFLTLAERGNYVIDDEHAYGPMAECGWQVEPVVWDASDNDWNTYQLVVIRSPWDYQLKPEKFLRVLGQIEASSARLENPLSIVGWNLEKTYLRDLHQQGVEIVPTRFADALAPGELTELFALLETDELVIKPQVGATASGAYRLHQDSFVALQEEVEAYYASTPLLVQPFLKHIETEGEYSLFYFNGEYSHAILKTPKANDFRSQEEHGADIQPIQANDRLQSAGRRALAGLAENLLYARVDFVRSNSSKGFQLMELELIEPALYFRTDPESPYRFAQAVHALMG